MSKAKVEKVKQAHRARVEALAVGCSSHRRPASQSPDLVETAVDEGKEGVPGGARWGLACGKGADTMSCLWSTAEEAQQETATGSCGGGCCSGGVLGKKNGGCGAAAGAEAALSPTACNGSTGRGKESGGAWAGVAGGRGKLTEHRMCLCMLGGWGWVGGQCRCCDPRRIVLVC